MIWEAISFLLHWFHLTTTTKRSVVLSDYARETPDGREYRDVFRSLTAGNYLCVSQSPNISSYDSKVLHPPPGASSRDKSWLLNYTMEARHSFECFLGPLAREAAMDTILWFGRCRRVCICVDPELTVWSKDPVSLVYFVGDDSTGDGSQVSVDGGTSRLRCEDFECF